MPLILGANQLTAGGYEVDNSLRFNSGSSDYLSRTPASAGNRKTFTISTWIKRSKLGALEYNIGATSDAWNLNYFLIWFNSSDQLNMQGYTTAGASQFAYHTTQVFRDVSAWYHLVIAVDTTQATSTNRIKIYLNGNQITTFITSDVPTQNIDTFWNSTNPHYIGQGSGGSYYFNGYQSDFYSIDGQQLTPSDFGEFDSDTNIWKPIPYTGTFGTNGFYLEFQDSSALGDDTSGNGNDFTVNNLTSIDQTTDTPTNNFCILNSLYKGSTTPNITEGNLKATNSGVADYQGASGTIPASTTGKWYWEFKAGSGVNGSTTETVFGAVRETRLSATSNQSAEFTADGITAYGSSFSITSGDIIGVTVDRTSAELKIYKNNSLIVTKTSLFNEPLFPYIAMYGSGINIECNFGNPPYSANSYTDGAGYGNFSYAVPSGYYSLNTRNLAQYG